jgi:hypothetical protein
MATKILTIGILLFIAMTSTFSTCKKGGLGCANTIYNFQISAKAFPDKDSIRINDTLWIEINTPVSLTELASGNIVNYGGASNLGMALSFDLFTGGSIDDPGSSFAANNFDYYLETGNHVNNPFTERIREYLFIEENNKYHFKLGIIPKQLGTYTVAISNATNVYRKNDKCTKAAFEIDFANTNQHLYFYQNNRPGYEISDYEKKHMYCFKVY